MLKFRYLLIVFFINFFLKSAYSQSCTENSNNTGSCTGPLNVTDSSKTIANSGTISLSDGSKFRRGISNSGSNNIITNLNTINLTLNVTLLGTTGGYTWGINNPGANNTVTNSGTINLISEGEGASSYGMRNTGSGNTFINSGSGSINATSTSSLGYAFNNEGSNLTFSNSGTLIGTSTSADGAGFRDRTGAAITNSGTIRGTSTSGAGYGLYLTGNNATITNSSTGTITGSTAGIFNSGTGVTINNSGTITKINNSSSSLSFTGKLPQYYNIIINSNSSYGKLSSTTPSESLIFGINSGSVVSTGTTYQDVLTGVSASNLSSLTGSYGAYNWTLASDGTNYDLTVVASRLAYNEIVTTSKLVNTATQLEAIRTKGTKTTLTNTLDNLSAAQLESAVKKIQGTTTVKAAAQSVQAQSSFKTALSTVTSPGSSSSMTKLTKTNQGNLTFADLQKNNLYAKIQSANYSDDSNFFDYKNNQVPINALEFFKSNRNLNLVEKDDLKDGGFFLRTFGSVTNYAAVNSDDNSYGSDSYGLLGGFQHKIDDNLYQGYSLGLSKSKLTLDAGEGNTKTNTIHANVYRKMDEKEYGATASLGGYVSFIDNVRNISETNEILKSSPTNGGLDFSVQYVKKMELLGLNFYPSASLTTTYGIVENYKETGGSGSALEIKSHNVLAIKPEIGFTLENNFVQTDKITEGANFSLFANRQQYLDGHTNTSSMIGENSWSASTLPKTKDDFLTAGIGYVAKNIDEKSDLNFNFFYTQSTNNSLNSSLFSISYNKTF
jgi:hypothetical protein